MLKQILVLSFASLIVGCASNGQKVGSTSDSRLKNFNIVEEQSLKVEGKTLPFLTFKKQVQKIVKEDGKTFKKTYSDFGSGVQWNSEYIVTVKHVSFAENSAYKCFEGCDIQFVKRAATGVVPSWRNVVGGEPLTFLGVNQNNELVQAPAVDLNIQTYTQNNSTVYANLSSSNTVGGMSGGPAYAADGKVVGILTGGTVFEGKDASVYLEYEVLKAAWDKFQSNQVAAK